MSEQVIKFDLVVDDKGSVKIRQFGEAVNKMDQEVRKSTTITAKWKDSLNKSESALDKLKSSVFSLKGAVVSLAGAYGIKRLAGSFVDAASTAEGFRVRLKVLLGSAEEGNRLFQEMANYASRVPFTYEEIMSSATQLAGVMKGGVDQIKKWMPMIGDLAAASGLSISETTGQVIRMFSAGAGAADLFRERGILAMLGFQAGVSYSAEETRKKLMEAWLDPASKFRNAADSLGHTWKGLLSMISDKWFKLRNLIMDAGVFDALKEALSDINDELGQWIENNKQLLAQNVRKYIRGITESMKSLISVYNSLPEGTVGAGAAGLIGTWLFGGQIGALMAAMVFVHTWAEKIKKVLGTATVPPLLGPLGPFLDSIKKLEKLNDELVTIKTPELPINLKALEIEKEYRDEILRNKKKYLTALRDFDKAEEEHRKKVKDALAQEFKERAKAAEAAYKADIQATLIAEKTKIKYLTEEEKSRKAMWVRMAENNKKMYAANKQAYLVAEESKIRIQEEKLKEMKANDLAYWVGVVNNANTTEDKLREAWQHINAIAKQNNIDAVQAFKLGWKDATDQFRTDSMTWLETGRDVANTLREDFSDFFLSGLEQHLNSFKGFWKGLWEDIKHIFFKAIADMLASKLVKEFFGLLGDKININFGKLTGGGALATAASGASLAGLIKKVPGVSAVLSKVPGLAGLLGLGGTAATAAIGAGAGVTGATSLALGGGTTAVGALGLGTAGALGLGAAFPLGLAALGFGGVFGHHRSWSGTVQREYQRYAGEDLMSMLSDMTKEGRKSYLWDISGVQAFSEKLAGLGPLYQNVAKQAAAFGQEQNNQRISYKADMDAAMNFSRALADQIKSLQGATGAGGALRARLVELKGKVDETANAARKNFAEGIREAIDALTKHTEWTRRASDAYRELGLAGKTVEQQIAILKNELNMLNKIDPVIDVTVKGHIDRTAQKILGKDVGVLVKGDGRVGGYTVHEDSGRAGTAWSDFDFSHHSGYNVPPWIPKHHSGYYPSSGEHLALIRNDETVLTPKQVQTVEKSIGATININGPLVTVSGGVDDAQIEKLARRIRTELTYLEELRQ